MPITALKKAMLMHFHATRLLGRGKTKSPNHHSRVNQENLVVT